MTRKTVLQLAVIPLFAVLALGSSSKKKGGDDEAPANSASTAAGALGKVTTVGDSAWTILDVVDRGSPMKPLESYEKEATTAGRFIQVHFKVENKGKKEGILGGGPTGKLVDGTGREFGTMERQSSFIPKGAETMVFEKIQPSMSKEFYAIYELPPGAEKLSFKATDFGLFGKDKTIPLGDIAAAPPPVASAAAAPAVKAAAPAAKGATTAAATGTAAASAKAKAAPATSAKK